MMLGTIFVVTPAVGWTWPVISPLIVAAAGTLGYKHMTTPRVERRGKSRLRDRVEEKRRTAVLPMEASVTEPVADELKREQRLVFTKGEIEVVFRRDVRGQFAVEVSGPDHYTLQQLRGLGTEFANTLVQQFAHNRVVQELEQRGMVVVEEEVQENGDIVVRGRRWS